MLSLLWTPRVDVTVYLFCLFKQEVEKPNLLLNDEMSTNENKNLMWDRAEIIASYVSGSYKKGVRANNERSESSQKKNVSHFIHLYRVDFLNCLITLGRNDPCSRIMLKAYKHINRHPYTYTYILHTLNSSTIPNNIPWSKGI